MKAINANFTAALICALVMGTPLMHHAWAVPCNSKTPDIGNCGTENKCEGRTSAACLASVGVYYEPVGGIACKSGLSNQYCAQVPGLPLKCTGEWLCEPVPVNGCKQSMFRIIGIDGNPVYATQPEYKSQTCTIGGH